jgi:hypothetical protein
MSISDQDREQYAQAMKFFFANGDYPNGPEQTAEEALKDIAAGAALAAGAPPSSDPFAASPTTANGVQDTTVSGVFAADRQAAAEAPAPAPEIPADWLQAASDARDHDAALVAPVDWLPSSVQPMAQAMQARGIDPADHAEFLNATADIVAALTVGVPIPDLAARAEEINKAAEAIGFTEPIFG